MNKSWLRYVLAWWLVAVYIFALAVYTFTATHYLGSLIGTSTFGNVTLELVIMGCLVTLNLIGTEQPALIQTLIVWVQFVVLGGVVVIGLWHWHPDHWAGRGSFAGAFEGALLTFIAFEGFEMLAYDQRELARPRAVMRESLPLAVVVVGAAYIFVILAAGSLVGLPALVREEDRPLVIVGRAAFGRTGEILISIAAVVAAVSAINATLFSTARLVRTSSERGVLPTWCARCNRRDVPQVATIGLGAGAVIVAASLPLPWLAGAASVGFLALFALVAVLALVQKSS